METLNEGDGCEDSSGLSDQKEAFSTYGPDRRYGISEVVWSICMLAYSENLNRLGSKGRPGVRAP